MVKKIAAPDLKLLFKKIPKIELHAHFAATLPLDFVNSINKYEADGVVIPGKYKNLENFIEFYGTLYGRKELNEKQLEEGSYLICMEAAEHNVKYIEIRFVAMLNTLSDEVICKSLQAGLLKAQNKLREKGFFQRSGIILTLLKNKEPYNRNDFSRKLKNLSQMLSDGNCGVVGLDIAGNEKIMSLESYECQAYIELGKKCSIPLTIHAGEVPDDKEHNYKAVDSINKAIMAGASRIGHGIQIINSSESIEVAMRRDICFEVCPSSNVLIGNVKSWDQLPIKAMLEAGLKVTVCTDDKALLNTDYSMEFERLYENNLITAWQDIKTLILNGVESSFTPPSVKIELIEEYRQDFVKIEEDANFSKVIRDYLS